MLIRLQHRPHMNNTAHTIKLQDGSLFNFKHRFKKHAYSLVQAFSDVKDGRSNRGKRHPLEGVLLIIFFGMLAGQTTIKGCWKVARHHWQFLSKHAEFPHGLPCQTTISRALQVCDVGSLVQVGIIWRRTVYGWEPDESGSFDGKTMRGVHGTTSQDGEGVIRHIVSLFTHQTHQTIGQVGVSEKENEIPAAKRLFKEVDIGGLTLVGDALHGQKDTAQTILEQGGNYFLFIKGNQAQLQELIAAQFTDPSLRSTSADYQQTDRGRQISTTVTISNDLDLEDLKIDWPGVNFIGQVHRFGTRKEKGEIKPIDETVYFIASDQNLTAQRAAKLVRSHWRIENNLHWQKDWTFHEDRQTLRLRAAPQVMTWLRSFCIGLMKLMGIVSVTDTIQDLQSDPRLHERFALLTGVV